MSELLNCFEIVWQMVNDKYFDPTFGGLDWNAVHRHYRPRITAVKDDKMFYELVAQQKSFGT